MCTVTWLSDRSGYQLLCNRDEKLSRMQAFGPRILHRDGVRFIAPLDADFGGTWIGVNEHGVALCLLNGSGMIPGIKSRGLLVLELISSASAKEAEHRLRHGELSVFAPFTLAILEPGRQTAVVDWDGRQATARAEPRPPLASSSFDQAGVQSSRQREFDRNLRAAEKIDAGALRAFHESHGAGPSAYSPCMHRPDAETVSFTRVSVTAAEVRLSYTPAAPCKRLAEETVALPCRTSS